MREAAWRDGEAAGAQIELDGQPVDVAVTRVGSGNDHLLWKLSAAAEADPMTVAARRIAGTTGERLAAAGVLAVLVDDDGHLMAANKPFADRALAGASNRTSPRFEDLVEMASDGQAKLTVEGVDARPLRAAGCDPRA